MMKTSTIVYAALFCAAMIASYLTWTKAPETVDDDGGIVLINAKPAEIAKIEYTSKDVDATFEQKTDELGKYLWVTTTRRVTKKKADTPSDPHAGMHDHGDDDGHDHPEPAPANDQVDGEKQVDNLVFKAGKAGEQLLEELAPFRVSRKLDLDKGDFADFGLDDPQGTLAVSTVSGTSRKFEVGATAYGHKHVYLRDTDSGEVFVIKRSIVSPLDRADTRLPEKELFEGPASDITTASISTPTGSLQLVQRNRDDASKSSWTAPDSDTANPSADSWLDKVFRLRSNGYIPASEQPEAELVFAVKLDFEDRKPVRLEVLRGADDNGEEMWVARSEFTRGMVKLNPSIAADAAADIATLFAAE